MKEIIWEQMKAFNQSYKEIEEIYREYAKYNGLSDSAFWIMYSLWERGSAYPQIELCTDWSYPPQTINSTLKSMERQGLIEISLIPGNKRNKQICFTAKGKNFAKKVIEPLVKAEQDSFFALSAEERSAVLSVMQKHMAFLRNNVSKIIELSSED